MGFRERKAERTERYFRFIYGWVLKPCVGCSGSGYWDNDGSPPCSSCGGTGKVRVRGPKSLDLRLTDPNRDAILGKEAIVGPV